MKIQVRPNDMNVKVTILDRCLKHGKYKVVCDLRNLNAISQSAFNKLFSGIGLNNFSDSELNALYEKIDFKPH